MNTYKHNNFYHAGFLIFIQEIKNKHSFCLEKQLEFSEYWHNEEKFYVHQILDDECKRAKRCESCKVDFPKENPKIGSDLVMVHKESYMRPSSLKRFCANSLPDKRGPNVVEL